MEGEEKTVGLTGLEPNREYAFCIVAYSLSGGLTEPSYGAAVPFETLPLPPAVDSESVSSVTSTGATLEAQVNPNNEHTNYTFEYSTTETAKKLTGTIVKANGTSELEGGSDQTASAPTGTLLPDTTYYYRVVAENEKSKEESKPADGTATPFTTAPEAPETLSPAKAVTATTAILEGVLNPKAASATEAGWYFAYNLGTSCAGGLTTSPEAEATVKAATESTEVEELQPDAKYTFCLVATNAAGAQLTMGNEVSVTTPVAPPTIETGSEKASGVTPYEATLEAQVNPNNQTTTYVFEYSTSNTLAGATTLKGGGTLSNYGPQTASASTGHVLTPGVTYYYRVVAENATHEKEAGPIEHFTASTAIAPAIESETSTVVSPFAATLEATVNPEYQEATCEFEYSTDSLLTTGVSTVPCDPASLGEGGGGVSATGSLAGLHSATKYYYRVAAKNGTGTTTDLTIGEFTTMTAEAPSVDSERILGVTAFTAQLEAVITPNFQATTCELQYGADPSLATETTVPCDPGQFGPTDRAEDTRVSLTGLQQNTTYYYRVLATNATGTTPAGTIEEFKTPTAPAITAGEAQNITSTTVLLSGGTVNPEGAETRYHIAYVAANEYQPGAANPYANGRSTPEASAGSESTPQPVASAQVSELQPGTTYDYAIIAISPAGTTVGPDQTFTTSTPIEPPSPTASPEVGQPAATLAPPFTIAPTPAFIPYISISALDAAEAHESKTTSTTKSLTRAQKLTKALKTCKKEKARNKRTNCERAARKKYGPIIKTKKKKKS